MPDHAKYISLTPQIYKYLEAHGHNGDPLRGRGRAEGAGEGKYSARPARDSRFCLRILSVPLLRPSVIQSEAKNPGAALPA